MLSKLNFLFKTPLGEKDNEKTEEENVPTEETDSKTVSVKSPFSHIQTASTLTDLSIYF